MSIITTRDTIISAAAAITAASERAELLSALAELQEALSALLEEEGLSPAELPAPPPANGHAGQLSLTAQAEALIFVAPEPLSREELGRLLEIDQEALAATLSQLSAELAIRGLRLQEADGRLQLVSAPEAAPLIERLLKLPASTRLSNAALETLAIVAYRQPITRVQIEAIRGVDCSATLRALLARELIVEAGRAESVGRPILYATTPEFLNQFGLASLADLPPCELPEAGTLDGASHE